MVPLPDRPMPMASVRQFMELAVYMPGAAAAAGAGIFDDSSTPSSSRVQA